MKEAGVALAIEFVELIPDHLENGTLYVSMEYSTISHLCACGCGREIVTPLSPVGWQLLYDGETVTLTPSIGNWSLACRSHYFIRKSRVVWAGKMSQSQIEAGRECVKKRTLTHYSIEDYGVSASHTNASKEVAATNTHLETQAMSSRGLVGLLLKWLRRWR